MSSGSSVFQTRWPVVDLVEVDRALAKPQLDAAFPVVTFPSGCRHARRLPVPRDHLIDTSPLLFAAGRFVAVEDQAVARLDRVPSPLAARPSR